MLRNRSLLIGVLLLVAVGGAFMYRKLFPPKVKEPVKHTGPVLVAKEDLYPRMILTEAMFEKKELPLKDIPETALTDPAEAIGFIVGGFTDPDMQFVKAGDIIEKDAVLGKVTDLGLPYLVPPFMRAVVVEMKIDPNFHDQLHIGNRLDILATFNNEYTTTLIENVEVLAVDNKADDAEKWSLDVRGPHTAEATRRREEARARGEQQREPEAPPPSVTLALTPRDAQRLALAMATSDLDYILRPMPEEQLLETFPGTLGPEGAIVEITESGESATAEPRQEGVTLKDIAFPLWEQREARRRPAVRQSAPIRQTAPPVVPSLPTPVTPVTQPVAATPPAPPMHEIEIITGNERQTVQVPKPEI